MISQKLLSLPLSDWICMTCIEKFIYSNSHWKVIHFPPKCLHSRNSILLISSVIMWLGNIWLLIIEHLIFWLWIWKPCSAKPQWLKVWFGLSVTSTQGCGAEQAEGCCFFYPKADLSESEHLGSKHSCLHQEEKLVVTAWKGFVGL